MESNAKHFNMRCWRATPVRIGSPDCGLTLCMVASYVQGLFVGKWPMRKRWHMGMIHLYLPYVLFCFDILMQQNPDIRSVTYSNLFCWSGALCEAAIRKVKGSELSFVCFRRLCNSSGWKTKPPKWHKETCKFSPLLSAPLPWSNLQRL